MRKSTAVAAITLLTLLWCVEGYSQYTTGHIIEVRGHVLDATNKDTMVFARLRLLSGDTYITGVTSDFDGAYLMRFCSNRVKTDSLVIEAEGLGCLKTRIVIKSATDNTLDIYLPLDPTFVNCPQARELYLRERYVDGPFCGTDEQQRLYDENPMFRHCDGRIESFQRLLETNARMEEWERL